MRRIDHFGIPLWLFAFLGLVVLLKSFCHQPLNKISVAYANLTSSSECVEKGPPYRPGRHLKGFPLRKREQGGNSDAEIFTQPSLLAGALVLSRAKRGFTLIELVMVILLLAILAAVAIPNFQDFRNESRDAATRGALGGIRSAIAISRAAIALKEDLGVPLYPTVIELQGNSYNGSHPVLNSLVQARKRILDGASGIPVNPWSLITIPRTQQSSVFDCSLLVRPNIRSIADGTDFGWCYSQVTGEFWANSKRNGAVSGSTENNF